MTDQRAERIGPRLRPTSSGLAGDAAFSDLGESAQPPAAGSPFSLAVDAQQGVAPSPAPCLHSPLGFCPNCLNCQDCGFGCTCEPPSDFYPNQEDVDVA